MLEKILINIVIDVSSDFLYNKIKKNSWFDCKSWSFVYFLQVHVDDIKIIITIVSKTMDFRFFDYCFNDTTKLPIMQLLDGVREIYLEFGLVHFLKRELNLLSWGTTNKKA